MNLQDFTSFDEVRAALGVSVDEIDDATLSLDVYLYGLRMELDEINSSLQTDYLTIAGKDYPDRSSAEQAVFEGVRVFCTYAVGVMLCTSLPLFSPKDITDGKAAVGRYADSPYKVVIEKTQAAYERYKTTLKTRYGVLKSASAAAVGRPWFSVVSPATDPVVE